MARPASSQPTDGELEILRVLWREGPSELGVVHRALVAERGRKIAKTTVATMLKVMLDKGLVRRAVGDREGTMTLLPPASCPCGNHKKHWQGSRRG